MKETQTLVEAKPPSEQYTSLPEGVGRAVDAPVDTSQSSLRGPPVLHPKEEAPGNHHHFATACPGHHALISFGELTRVSFLRGMIDGCWGFSPPNTKGNDTKNVIDRDQTTVVSV
ncbi:hypothetical protein HRR83_000002 [Exophiala dermatitidis]|uniref:Uncharacterized protein n=1 Tax=Exophiala dermatitidis TaxID=5970 RepID=A0AAN6F1T6_EXODE|nr:hypothetical protein HRR73_009595 [Exophiala dermatitidis]KAJ4527250.1 hypothetical protein HRR74_000002 [Exophiala dermatitidis]KAJ4530803.1 hypothetical protein HRR76_008498 [Exophiala dermatitidis]KAJ4557974.1 hypothetical protein HRR77_000002 [Exophiala dermatitidis]KAJ4581996.1 hypothetical protein HRR79_000995 [Exophiala dermatitidis]